MERTSLLLRSGDKRAVNKPFAKFEQNGGDAGGRAVARDPAAGGALHSGGLCLGLHPLHRRLDGLDEPRAPIASVDVSRAR